MYTPSKVWARPTKAGIDPSGTRKRPRPACSLSPLPSLRIASGPASRLFRPSRSSSVTLPSIDTRTYNAPIGRPSQQRVTIRISLPSKGSLGNLFCLPTTTSSSSSLPASPTLLTLRQIPQSATMRSTLFSLLLVAICALLVAPSGALAADASSAVGTFSLYLFPAPLSPTLPSDRLCLRLKLPVRIQPRLPTSSPPPLSRPPRSSPRRPPRSPRRPSRPRRSLPPRRRR